MSIDKVERTQALRIFRRAITVPAAAGTAATISSLASLTSAEIAGAMGCKILGLLSTGSDRGAIVCGDGTSSQLQYVASAADYYEPGTDDFANTYIKAASGAAIANTVVVFYTHAVN